jgi:hypothetical protein
MENPNPTPEQTTNPMAQDPSPSAPPSSVERASPPPSESAQEPSSKSLTTETTSRSASEKHVLGHGGPAGLFRSRASLYVGNVQTGKTCKALDDLFSLTAQTKDPFLAIDCICARNFKPYEQYRVRTVKEVIKRLYGERRHCIWQPGVDIDEECDAVFTVVKQAADSGRRITLFIDEISQLSTAWRMSKPLGLLFRAHSHINLSIFCTTQYAGDCPPVVMNLTENCFCFCTTSPRGVKRMQETFGFDPETMKSLVVGEYLQNSR